MTESNYTKQVYIARDIFLTFDQQKIIDKFQLEHDEDHLYIQFLDEYYRISRKTGEIEISGREGAWHICQDYDVVMTVYDVLCHSEKTPVLSGEWCQLHSLQVTMSSPGVNKFTQSCADACSGKVERLWKICRKIGGIKPDIAAGSDVWWQFNVFPFFPVQFRYWDKDEEFPAQIQLLWDRNSLDFMHFETLYYVIGHLTRKLQSL